MAVIVQTTRYQTPDGAYSTSCRVTLEPKTGLYEVNLYVNDAEHERGYFDDRKTALVFAHTGLMDRWLSPVEWPLPEQDAPEVAELPRLFVLPQDEPECPVCNDMGCNRCDDTGRAEPAPVDRYGRSYAERAELADSAFYLDGGCTSRDPAKCRCGDCLTYLAGEQA